MHFAIGQPNTKQISSIVTSSIYQNQPTLICIQVFGSKTGRKTLANIMLPAKYEELQVKIREIINCVRTAITTDYWTSCNESFISTFALQPKNRMTNHNSRLAGESSKSSVANGCCTKTEPHSKAGKGGNWSGGNNLHASIAGSLITPLLEDTELCGTYFTNAPRKSYHNMDVARKLWQEIAEELKSPSEVIKAKWQNLRDHCRREHAKISKVPTGSAVLDATQISA
nr:unnamed protein product [Callosobruchus analis]